MEIRAEFTVYPFVTGESLPAHVQAAIDAVNRAGLVAEIGALANVVTGEASLVLAALEAGEEAALAAGATRIVVSVETTG